MDHHGPAEPGGSDGERPRTRRSSPHGSKAGGSDYHDPASPGGSDSERPRRRLSPHGSKSAPHGVPKLSDDIERQPSPQPQPTLGDSQGKESQNSGTFAAEMNYLMPTRRHQVWDMNSPDLQGYNPAEQNWLNVPAPMRLGLQSAYVKIDEALEDSRNLRNEVLRLENNVRKVQDRFNAKFEGLQVSLIEAASSSRRRSSRKSLLPVLTKAFAAAQQRDSVFGKDAMRNGSRGRLSSVASVVSSVLSGRHARPEGSQQSPLQDTLDLGSTADSKASKPASRVPSNQGSTSNLNSPRTGPAQAELHEAVPLCDGMDSSSSEESARGGLTEDERKQLGAVGSLQTRMSDFDRQVSQLRAVMKSNQERLESMSKRSSEMWVRVGELSDSHLRTVSWQATLEHLPTWFQAMGAIQEASADAAQAFFAGVARAPTDGDLQELRQMCQDALKVVSLRSPVALDERLKKLEEEIFQDGERRFEDLAEVAEATAEIDEADSPIRSPARSPSPLPGGKQDGRSPLRSPLRSPSPRPGGRHDGISETGGEDPGLVATDFSRQQSGASSGSSPPRAATAASADDARGGSANAGKQSQAPQRRVRVSFPSEGSMSVASHAEEVPDEAPQRKAEGSVSAAPQGEESPDEDRSPLGGQGSDCSAQGTSTAALLGTTVGAAKAKVLLSRMRRRKEGSASLGSEAAGFILATAEKEIEAAEERIQETLHATEEGLQASVGAVRSTMGRLEERLTQAEQRTQRREEEAAGRLQEASAELKDLLEKAKAEAKDLQKVSQEKIQAAEVRSSMLEQRQQGFQSQHEALQGALREVSDSIDKVANDRAEWAEALSAKLQTVVDGCVHTVDGLVQRLEEERQRFNSDLSILFPRALAQANSTAELNINEARLFTCDTKIAALEERITLREQADLVQREAKEVRRQRPSHASIAEAAHPEQHGPGRPRSSSGSVAAGRRATWNTSPVQGLPDSLSPNLGEENPMDFMVVRPASTARKGPGRHSLPSGGREAPVAPKQSGGAASSRPSPPLLPDVADPLPLVGVSGVGLTSSPDQDRSAAASPPVVGRRAAPTTTLQPTPPTDDGCRDEWALSGCSSPELSISGEVSMPPREAAPAPRGPAAPLTLPSPPSDGRTSSSQQPRALRAPRPSLAGEQIAQGLSQPEGRSVSSSTALSVVPAASSRIKEDTVMADEASAGATLNVTSPESARVQRRGAARASTGGGARQRPAMQAVGGASPRKVLGAEGGARASVTVPKATLGLGV